MVYKDEKTVIVWKHLRLYCCIETLGFSSKPVLLTHRVLAHNIWLYCTCYIAAVFLVRFVFHFAIFIVIIDLLVLFSFFSSSKV